MRIVDDRVWVQRIMYTLIIKVVNMSVSVFSSLS